MQLTLIAATVLVGIGVLGLIYVLKANKSRPGTSIDPTDESRLALSAPMSRGASEDLQPPLTTSQSERSTADRMLISDARRLRDDRRSTRLERAELKAACLAILDAAAVEHAAGHGKMVARYILRSQNDERIELMFEKDEKSRAHLWLAKDYARGLLNGGLEVRSYPAAGLYQAPKPGGTAAYGRHSGLKTMRDLANADLERFTVGTVGEAEVILDYLKRL